MKRSNLIQIVSDDKFYEMSNLGKFYLGIDPTGRIHIGHLISIKLCLDLLEKGFDGILLIGGFTGKIGDPTDKLEARKKLTNTIAQNFSTLIYEDLYTIFENYRDRIIFVNNKDWLDTMTFAEYLNISYNISVNRKLNLETFSNRLSKNLPLSVAEFTYPDVQMIDFLHLCKNYNCNIQVGGSDQWGNISHGVHYVKKITKREDIFGLCTPLLTENGKKIGKTDGNPVYIENHFGVFQYCMRISTETLKSLGKIFIENFPEDILEVNFDQVKLYQLELARSLLKIICPKKHEEVFQNIKTQSEEMFYRDVEHINENFFDSIKTRNLLTIISEQTQKSKSEIKRKLSEGAIFLNNVKQFDPNLELSDGKYKIKLGNNVLLIKIS